MIFLRTLAILILIAPPALADEVVMVGFGGGGSCELGFSTEGGTGEDMGVGTAYLYTASCSGTLTTAYIYHNSSATDNAKLCVYLDDGDEAPDVSDTTVACSSAISCNTDGGWCSNTYASGSITSGNKYWVIIVPDMDTPTNFATVYNAVATSYYKTFSYGSPPANLDGTWSSRSRKHSAYATVVY